MPDIDQSLAEKRAAERNRLWHLVSDATTKVEFEAAFQQVTVAAQHYEAQGDSEGRVLTFNLLGACYRRLNDLPASLEKHQQGYEFCEAIGDVWGCADALRAKAGTLRLLGRDQEAIRDLKQSCAIYQQIGKRLEEMRTLMNLSILYKQCGDVAASQALLFECLPFFEQGEYNIETAKVLLNIASNYNVLENASEAIRFAQQGIALFEAAEDRHYLSLALAVLGESYLEREDYDTAQEQLSRALQIAEEVGILWAIAIILDHMSRALIALKRFDEARAALERCLQINGSDGNRLVYCENRAQLGRLYANPEYAGHDVERALAYLHEAQQVAEGQNAVMLLARIYKSLADLHEYCGKYPEALEAFRSFHDADKRLFNEESDKRIKRLEVEKAQKEAEIAHLRMVELAQALEEAERMRVLADERARTDALTGVLNRRALEEHLTEEYERSQWNGHPLAVALVDIDHFKAINDSLGHGAGDETLRQVARILRTCCRSSNDRIGRFPGEERRNLVLSSGDAERNPDRIARYGGEEFALLFPETNLSEALKLCDRLREAIANHDWTTVHPDLAAVTVSVGVSLLDQSNHDQFASSSDLLAEADQNLYRGKRGGKNRVVG